MSINISEVEKLAKLARLELKEEEKKKYAADISSILNYISQLQEIRVKDESMSVAEGPNRLRADRVIGLATEKQKKLINQAPEQENNLIKTKAIFE